MKLSAGLTRLWPSMCVFLLFCTGAGLQAVALRRTELGVAVHLGSRAVRLFSHSFSVSLFWVRDARPRA